jgi:hypothetical protein
MPSLPRVNFDPFLADPEIVGKILRHLRLPRSAPSLTPARSSGRARANAARHGVEKNTRFIEANLVPDSTETLGADAVVSNPPYVSTKELAQLPKEVKDFEPVHALHAGEDGLEVYRRLAPSARRVLRPGEKLLVKQNNQWSIQEKPRPADVDDWRAKRGQDSFREKSPDSACGLRLHDRRRRHDERLAAEGGEGPGSARRPAMNPARELPAHPLWPSPCPPCSPQLVLSATGL